MFSGINIDDKDDSAKKLTESYYRHFCAWRLVEVAMCCLDEG